MVSKASGILKIMEFLTFSKNEMRLYSAVSGKSMTVKQIEKRTRLSERTVRTHLDSLMDKELVRRRPVEGDRLMYEYYAEEMGRFVKTVKAALAKMEKKRIARRDAIVSGRGSK